MSLRISERSAGDVTILDLSGRVLLGEESSRLRQTIRNLLNQGRRKILLNLSGVTHIDSGGNGEFVSAFTAVRNQGGNLKFFSLRKKILELWQITKLLTVYEIYADEVAGLRSFEVRATYCLCPLCKSPSQPTLLDEREPWPPQSCSNCGCEFEVQSAQGTPGQVAVVSLRLETEYGWRQYIQVIPGRPFRIEILGRLDLFSSSTLKKVWKALPTPRRVLFDLHRTTEISDAGRDVLLALPTGSEDTRAAVSLEGLRPEQIKAFQIKPPVCSARAEALAALGRISETPTWITEVVTGK